MARMLLSGYKLALQHANTYWRCQALKETLPGLLARVRPNLVLYNAGVDVHAEDALGKMALTDAGELTAIVHVPRCMDTPQRLARKVTSSKHELLIHQPTRAGIAARDEFVLRTCAEAGAPVAAAIGGGYSPDHEAIVQRHVLLHDAARLLLPLLRRNGRVMRAGSV